MILVVFTVHSMETLGEMQKQIDSFVNITEESTDKARQFLQATNWNLFDAIQLFYAQSDSHEIDSGDVRPALPIQREALYDSDNIQSRDQQSAHLSSQPNSSWAFCNGDDENRDALEELYRPPFELMFRGSFEQAKIEAAGQGKWLIANIQSAKEFNSYTLNSDTWANPIVKEIMSAFIFWQIYDESEEGRKVCGYYNLTEMPATLVIDSITGQAMEVWTGMIKAQRLLEDLLPYMDKGPKEFSHPGRRAASNVNETEQSNVNETKQAEGNALAASASLDIKQDNPEQVEGNVLFASTSLDIKEDNREQVEGNVLSASASLMSKEDNPEQVEEENVLEAEEQVEEKNDLAVEEQVEEENDLAAEEQVKEENGLEAEEQAEEKNDLAAEEQAEEKNDLEAEEQVEEQNDLAAEEQVEEEENDLAAEEQVEEENVLEAEEQVEEENDLAAEEQVEEENVLETEVQVQEKKKLAAEEQVEKEVEEEEENVLEAEEQAEKQNVLAAEEQVEQENVLEAEEQVEEENVLAASLASLDIKEDDPEKSSETC